MSGFCLCCVANNDAARVEICFSKKSRQENKQAFDYLYEFKAELESRLNTTLEWNRGDDIISSKIFTQMGNVSIKNKADWFQMANFHAEWSKKFFDVIVPYVKTN